MKIAPPESLYDRAHSLGTSLRSKSTCNNGPIPLFVKTFVITFAPQRKMLLVLPHCQPLVPRFTMTAGPRSVPRPNMTPGFPPSSVFVRSEEHTSELQSHSFIL